MANDPKDGPGSLVSEREDAGGNRIEVRRRGGKPKGQLVVIGNDRDDNTRLYAVVASEDHTTALDDFVLRYVGTLKPTRRGLKLVP